MAVRIEQFRDTSPKRDLQCSKINKATCLKPIKCFRMLKFVHFQSNLLEKGFRPRAKKSKINIFSRYFYKQKFFCRKNAFKKKRVKHCKLFGDCKFCIIVRARRSEMNHTRLEFRFRRRHQFHSVKLSLLDIAVID